jgi:putative phosphoesterase
MAFDRNQPRNVWTISDTHLKAGQILPETFTEKVSRGDIVIHLGDFVSADFVKQIENIATLEAVYGNCDPPLLRQQFSPFKIINLYDKKIGLIHGWGSINDTLHNVKYEFGDKVDMVIFGHTHIAHHSKSNGIVYFNPGSLTQSRKDSNSFGMIHFNDNELWGEIIDID